MTSSLLAADPGLGPYVPRVLAGPHGTAGPGHWETEGTLLFADISGFTRLTEKLARQGKVGAEEIVRAISSVFTALLDASTDGGDVLKFSGDALIIFHSGDDHARRACHTALTMQRTLRAVGSIDSSRGRVRLRMSVGVHSGRFRFVLCGGNHLELYILGEAASTTVAMEAAAEPGEVLASRATSDALQGAALIVPRRAGVAVRSVPRPAPHVIDVREQPDGLERFVAPPLRDRLGRADAEHEHRRATVAFIGFGGTDDLLRTAGPDEVCARVQTLTTAAMAALDEYGVLLTATDVAVDGGVLMLTAGAPDSLGDDEARMLRVVQRVLATDCGLRVRVGVNAGTVFVGAVGPSFRRTYSTMGAATNLAARLMGQARWGEVLASTAVTDEVRGRFALDDVRSLAVRGSARAVNAAVVRGAIEATAAAVETSAPLVGRDRELAALRAAWSQARDGHGRAVEVVGDPGAGKSRLVAELRAAVGEATWCAVCCDPYERTSPYHSARLLLRLLLGVPATAGADEAGAAVLRLVTTAAPDLLPWLPLIAVPVGAAAQPTPQVDEVAPRYRRVRTEEAVCDLLAALPPRPTVVVVEDATHMDPPSAGLIAAMMTRVLPTRPWLAVVTRLESSDGLQAERGYPADEIRLAPLDAKAASELAARLAERTPVPAHVLPQLVERAAGNPLFLAELVAAQASGYDQMPHSVEAIVAARIDQLAPDDRRALRFLSVLGDRFSGALLTNALGDVLAPLGIRADTPESWARLEAFVARDGDGLAFRNGLVRRVAYEGLSFRRRRELHGRVADALRASDGVRAAQLPLHLTRAERWAEAWAAAVEAAEDARRNALNASAGELYELALTAARHLQLPHADVAQVAVRAGEAWEMAGLAQRALEAYAAAAAVTTDEAGQVLTLLRRGRVHEGAGRYPSALRLYGRAQAALQAMAAGALTERCRARVHLSYASARLHQGRFAASVDHARRAVGPAERGGDLEALAQAYHLLDRSFAALGDDETAARYRDLALPVYAELGDLPAQGTVLYDLGADAHRAGRLEEALWLYQRSHDVRRRAGDVVGAAACGNAVGEVLVALDRPSEAVAHFTAALRDWRGARSPEGVAVATRNLGTAALRNGDATEALTRLEEAAAVARRLHADTLLPGIRLPLAEALLTLGRFVEAWEAATLVTEAPAVPAPIAAAAHRVRGEALLRTGGFARARRELQLAHSLADGAGADDVAAAVQRLLIDADRQPRQTSSGPARSP